MSRQSPLGHRPSCTLTHPYAAGSETDDYGNPGAPTCPRSQDVGDRQTALPTLKHRLEHDSSILAIVVSTDEVYAGTQNGEILAYNLSTFERKAVIEGHRGSVLGLYLCHTDGLLFSSSGDRIVNVWDVRTLRRKYCLLSSFDVGDMFCVAYSDALKTVYMGAQNTTVQWCRLRDDEQIASTNSSHEHSSLRDDPFFDSAGPGGVRTPRPIDANSTPKHAVSGTICHVGKENVKHFAHYGYVYCMHLVKDGIPESAGHEVLITAGGDGVVKLWKLKQGDGDVEELFTLDDGREEGHSILSIAVDGTFLYCGRSRGEVTVWDLETRQVVRNLEAHRDDVLTVCIGGGFMFSAGVTGHVRKYDRQYRHNSQLKAHHGRILASSFTYHQQRPIYITGGNDCTLAIWDVSDCMAPTGRPAKTSNEQLIESLRRFVSFRTVSSDEQYQVDCRRGASYLRSVFKNFGAATDMLTTPEAHNPVILARFRGNPATADKRKKILFYGHYDVVDAENSTGKWSIDPFAMEGINGYLYGRGTSDNKGPLMAAIFACAELTSEQALGSDIIFLIEGEEESGSRGFEKAVKAHKDKIGDVDWILLANSYWLDDRIPCLTYGLRGVIHATVQVESNLPDLHSGVDGSSQLDESLKDLVMLMSTLTGKEGKVRIPGFYDPIPEITDGENELYKDITEALVQRNPELGDAERLATSLKQRWRDPSLTIHHFQTSGPNNATIIPRLAKAAISMRLVPNQEAPEVAKALVEYLETQFQELDSNNKLTITIDHLAEPWLGDWTNEIFKTLEAAVMDAWGPIEPSRRRRSTAHKSTNGPLHATTSGNNHGYFGNAKPIPATSTVLANGSAAGASPAFTPLAETAPTQGSPSPAVSHTAHRSSGAVRDYAQDTPQQPRRKPLYIREGGSIPAIRFLEKEFDAPAAHFPCGQASDSAHLDNERLRLVNLYKSKDIFKRVFRELPQK